ncbi:MAG: hypothetical protein ABIJ83_02045 [Patescibacteria group bacterium]
MSSVWIRKFGTDEQRKILSLRPIEIPKNYLNYLNESQTNEELFLLRKLVNKNIPFGNDNWVEKIVDKFKLDQTLRGVGRPKNGG